MANLLTDIIRDVAKEAGIELTDKQAIILQSQSFNEIIRLVSWEKQNQIKQVAFPWLEKEKYPEKVA